MLAICSNALSEMGRGNWKVPILMMGYEGMCEGPTHSNNFFKITAI